MYCKDCKFWENGVCDGVGHPDVGFGWGQDPERLFEVNVWAADDTDLGRELRTGPNFGCVRFVSRNAF